MDNRNTIQVSKTIDEFLAQTSASLPLNEEQEKRLVDNLTSLESTRDLVEFWKYPFQEYTVVTRDGYHLGIHRIPFSRHTAEQDSSKFRPPVLLWHGLCISSEAFVCHVDPSLNLALFLCDAGFDVWMGNSRGNKYSQRHSHLSVNDKEFWRFCIDELAEFDLPDTIDFILEMSFGPVTHVPYFRGPEKARPKLERTLAYIGYSQGTAMAFSALSQNHALSDKISVFIALAPAMKPKPLKNRLITLALHYTSPSILYPLLGHFSFLPVAAKVAKHYPDWFHPIVDGCFKHVFGWYCDKFGPSYRKKALYSHLFSTSSVRNVVHWFQIIAHEFRPYHEGKLQRHDSKMDHLQHDKPRSVFSWSSTASHTLPPKHPTHLITVPMHLFHGSADNISDIEYLTSHLNHSVTQFHEIENYSHMDFVWATDVKTKVWHNVTKILHERMSCKLDRRDRIATFRNLLENKQ